MEMKNLFPIFCFLLVGFPVVSAQECGANGSLTPHVKYHTNRGLLLSSLASNVSAHGGFYNASVGQGPDQVYAMGMCIQGAKREVCSNCIDLASKSMMEKCPNQTEGLAWPENGILCMVRYSNRSFFGSLEMKPRHILTNTGDIRSNLTKFNRTWEDLTNRMIAEATSSSSEGKYYAAEKVPLTSFQNIYALMQCTPIISLGDCNICLSQSVSDFESLYHGKQGGIVFRPSCVFRWETYPFSQAFNLTFSFPPTTQRQTSLPPPVGHRTNTNKTRLVVVIVCSTVMIFLLILALVCFWAKMRITLNKFSR